MTTSIVYRYYRHNLEADTTITDEQRDRLVEMTRATIQNRYPDSDVQVMCLEGSGKSDCLISTDEWSGDRHFENHIFDLVATVWDDGKWING